MFFFTYFQAPATWVSRHFKTLVSGSKYRQKTLVFGFGKTRERNTTLTLLCWHLFNCLFFVFLWKN